MLNHFDTVFAFVAVMTGVSLMVTSLTQVVGGLLGLRGRHLRWGVEALLENYLPTMKGYGAAVSGQLLKHPLVSDSMFSGRGRVPLGGLGRAMDFLWRGWRYATVVRSDELVVIVANLSEKVDEIVPVAERALTVVRSGRKPEEISQLLLPEVKALASYPGLAGPWTEGASRFVKAYQALPAGSGAGSSAHAAWVKELETFFRAVIGMGILADQLRTTRAADVGGGAVASVAPAGNVVELEPGGVRSDSTSTPSQSSTPTQPVALAGSTEEERPTLGPHWNRWFDGTMDRVSERFATNMRLWTVGFSLLVAFGGGLDALGLFNRLSADPEYRAMMVAGVERVARRAGDANVVGERNAIPEDPQARERLEEQVAELKVLIRENADLGIFSLEGPLSGGARGFLGRLASAILLSLGAPFWFNALKKMANLRPSLANKEEGGK